MASGHHRHPEWKFARAVFFSAVCVCVRAYTSPTATERTVICAAPLQHISLSWELSAINIHNTIAPYSGDKRTVNCELMALVEGRDDDLSGFRKPLRRVSRFVGSHCPVPIQPISMLLFSATCCSRVQIKVQPASWSSNTSPVSYTKNILKERMKMNERQRSEINK
jgi:hypothetical protein